MKCGITRSTISAASRHDDHASYICVSYGAGVKFVQVFDAIFEATIKRHRSDVKTRGYL